MNFNDFKLQICRSLLRGTTRRNRGVILLAAVFLLAGCGRSPGDIEYSAAFTGAVAADEPLAATVGADILKQGGSAVDAAVAMYFALSVTYPSAASLGGGGVCLVADWRNGEVSALDFLAPRPGRFDGGIRQTAVPANVRGMSALHARHGDLDWRVLLAPAEKLARFGHRVSRAAAREFEAGASDLARNWETRRIFAATGRPPVEGDVLVQKDLADTLEKLRIGGAMALYGGSYAKQFAGSVRGVGGTLSVDDLRDFAPNWQTAAAVEFGNDNAYFAPPPAGAGLVAAQMWALLTDGGRYRRAGGDERLHLLAETAKLAFTGRSRWLADDGTGVDMAELIAPRHGRETMKSYNRDSAGVAGSGPDLAPARVSSTGLVALDSLGGSVACNFTMYEPFGAGVVAPGAGILMAPSPGAGQRNPLSLGPMIVFNPKVRSFKFAAAGGAGPAGPTAMINVAMEALVKKRGGLEAAMNAGRVHAPGPDGAVIVERSLGDEQKSALAARGHTVREAPSLGRVNAIHCANGYPVEPRKIDCRAEADPRGLGLAVQPH